MLAKRERRLLVALGVVVALSLLTIALILGMERLGAARVKAAQYEAQIAKLSRSLPSESDISALRESLKKELDARKARFYSPDQMNPYSFGTLIKKELTSHGITVIRYQVIEIRGKSSLEFSVSGNVKSLILFLQDVSRSEKYWTISSLTLTMREGTERVDAVFRIGYEVLDKKNS